MHRIYDTSHDTNHDAITRHSAGFDSLAVHGGRSDFRALCVHAPPLDLSTTYPLDCVDDASLSLDAQVAGGEPTAGQPVYARLHNPTVARFEEALAALESADWAVAFASGMAALTASLLASRIVARGAARLAEDASSGHVVAVRPLYGGSDHLLTSGLLGFETTWTDAGSIAEAIRADTCLVVVETPANPTLHLVDIADVVRQASGSAHGPVPVLVDSTFATPVLQQPLEHGATLVLHSATKFLGGHGDVLAGVVATSDPSWSAALRQVRIATGAVLHPLAGYLLHRGLATLPVRVRAAQENATFLAERLRSHPAVASVRFPGSDPEDARLLGPGRQMAGPGCLVAFELRLGGSRSEGHDEAAALEATGQVLGALRMITPAVSLGSTDTLIQHPGALTHRVVDAAERSAHGISPTLLRLSVGLEDVEDLWADLSQALDAVRAEGRRAA